MKSLLSSLAVLSALACCSAKKVHYVHWNSASPVFRIDNTDHIVDVKEFDQVNLICPVAKAGEKNPEHHVVYSVSKEEYESCRITNPKPKIVAVCNQPHRLMYFTITFRSFTPTPGGLEFHPGHDYYFISTSSRSDLHRRVGGGCATHNMRMEFRVHPNPAVLRRQQKLLAEMAEQQRIRERQQEQLIEEEEEEEEDLSAPRINSISGSALSERVPRYRVSPASSSSPSSVYYYHPRDVLTPIGAGYDDDYSSSSSDQDVLDMLREPTTMSLPYRASTSAATTTATSTSLLFLVSLLIVGRTMVV